MELEKYFWFFNDNTSAIYFSDLMISIIGTPNGKRYMKSRNRNHKFHIKSKIVQEIIKKMKYKHSDLNIEYMLKFVENICKHGYSVTKYKYIRKERPDIMNHVKIIEKNWLQYKKRKLVLELSMNIENLKLNLSHKE